MSRCKFLNKGCGGVGNKGQAIELGKQDREVVLEADV